MWLEWMCFSCGNEQTTRYEKETTHYVAICSRCRIVHIADRHSMTDSNPRRVPAVDMPLAPNGQPLHIGPRAFQSAHVRPHAVDATPVPASDGDAP